jgi:hypothetical protein
VLGGVGFGGDVDDVAGDAHGLAFYEADELRAQGDGATRFSRYFQRFLKPEACQISAGGFPILFILSK